MADPERIDRYEIRDVLGKGAMGSVYRAFDPKLHREVALKVVTADLARETKARERFQREARAIAALKHTNIVEIYDYSGEESEYLYLVMEKLDGDDLFNIMNAKGVLPEPAAAAVGHELCLALQLAHDAGIIHRDLKPENVFLNGVGRVVLTDFGVVKAIREDAAVDGWAQKTDVIGTPGFMAPELMMNRSLGPRTDLFALGALLYNITTGELPFDGASPVEMFRAAVAGKYTDPRKYNRLLSDEFCEVLDGCLQAKPKKRFRSAEQVRETLKGVLEANGVSDLRDDLRDFMRDSVAYNRMARRRATSYLLQRIKVAVKDKEEALANKMRERLLIVDPENDELQQISGFVMTDSGHISVPSETPSRPQTLTGSAARWLYLAAGGLTGVTVILAGYLMLRPKSKAPADSPPTLEAGETPADEARPEVPVAAAKAATLEISIKGGSGLVWIDNKRVGKITQKGVKVEAGKHVIEVRGKGKRLKKLVQVKEGETLEVTADLKKGKFAGD
ncbi:MAG: serine/threonine protein kinase [Deltaproteobacteria bacterium]|nr:serine/threonine protein kinase [Deltaproteobacteria bacterium]